MESEKGRKNAAALMQTLRVTDQLAQKVEGQLTKGQRDLLLRRRLKAIKDELGDADGNGDEDDDIVILEKRLEAANLPPHAQASIRLPVTFWRLDERVWTWTLPKFSIRVQTSGQCSRDFVDS
jgi:ATP-dependent Lon protease